MPTTLNELLYTSGKILVLGTLCWVLCLLVIGTWNWFEAELEIRRFRRNMKRWERENKHPRDGGE